MLKAELLQIIANGENSGVSFKRDDVRPEQLAKELVALANFEGGRLLLGVEDDGSISELSRPDTERWLMETVFGRYVHPQILPFYEEVVVGDQRVAVATVRAGTSEHRRFKLHLHLRHASDYWGMSTQSRDVRFCAK